MITAEKVRELFNYDPDSGHLTWKLSSNRHKVGDRAGSMHAMKISPRLKICIAGRFYLIHRLIWLHQTGAWPEHLVDHVNMNGLDNSWRNLREATNAQNNYNCPKKKSRFTTLKGVRFDRRYNRYVAAIKNSGKSIYLGSFKTEVDAHEAYKTAAIKIAGEFSCFARRIET